MQQKIKIGSRNSPLALWQTHYIAALLNANGWQTELVTMETKGDKVLNASFSEIGTKGLFTEELEEQLKTGQIDIAVHSAKDMQTELGAGLDIIAFTEREESNDVLVSFDANFSLDATAVVGTSSTRRKAMLKHYFPHITTTEARGNLQTRMKKMEEGKCQAMILAYAGMHRMNYDKFIIQKLPLDVFTPAVGQGSLAIESSHNVPEEKRKAIRQIINHTSTEYCLLTERSFLRTLQGGCSIPVFGLANLEGNTITISGGVISLDGKDLVRETLKGEKEQAEQIGKQLAEKILQLGGDKILADINNTKK